MREIKFRGKEIATKKWIYGDLVQDLNSNEVAINGILIDIKTLGQYTGTNDKNGKKIWEGDFIDDGNCNEDAVGLVIYDKDDARFCIQYGDMIYEFTDLEYGKNLIIGNEYDNPELLWWE